MNGKTHFVWSLALGLAFAFFFKLSGYLLLEVLVISVIVGLLPDIDHPRSTLGRWFKIVNYGVKHRGFMHSIWMIILLGLIAFFFLRVSYLFVIVGVCSYVLHLFLDTITPAGVNWLYPFFRVRGPIKSDGLLSIAVFLLGVMFAAVLSLLYFLY